MGAARQRQLASKAQLAAIKGQDLDLTAHAVRAVLGGAGMRGTANCQSYALLGAELVRDLGVPAMACAGYAAWRVGTGPGDVLMHFPMGGAEQWRPDHEGRFEVFHAWIEVGDWIIDFTTADLPLKAEQLDAADGGATNVEWAPKYLIAHRTQVSPIAMVRDGYEAGIFAYARQTVVEEAVLGRAAELEILDSLKQPATRVLELLRNGCEVKVVCAGQDGHHGLVRA